MAQRSATVRADGRVVKHRRVRGDFKGSDGETVDYDFIEARFLTTEYDAFDVRFPSDGSVPLPRPEDTVTVLLDARVAGGNLKLTVERVLDREPTDSELVS